MSVPLLDALAQANYSYEGNRPPSRAYRNCNPGNLRPTAAAQEHDAAGYRVFTSFAIGYLYLLDDLGAKVSGHNTHGLGPNSTLLQLYAVYAPAGDSNNPEAYVDFVLAWLQQTYPGKLIDRSDSFAQIYKKIGQEGPSVVSGS